MVLQCKVIDNFSIRKKKTVICAVLTLVFTLTTAAQTTRERFNAYIDTYKDLAIEQCRTHGVPASITLAQGLLESNAGSSYLATHNNNHFGIKFHKRANMEADTLGGEYSAYSSAAECYDDHSVILCSKRYSSLHKLDTTDYKGWAHGLKRCGYAEDPAYASKLISIIESYKLLQYDSIAMKPAPVVEVLAEVNTSSEPERKERKPGEVPYPTKKKKNEKPDVPLPPKGRQHNQRPTALPTSSQSSNGSADND